MPRRNSLGALGRPSASRPSVSGRDLLLGHVEDEQLLLRR